MTDMIGYVVIEYNQASHQPSVESGLFREDELEDAQRHLDSKVEFTSAIGRRERYAIGTVYIEED